jgi:signal recognition particle GTPase
LIGHRARHVAFEDDAPARRLGIGDRHGRQQRLGVGVLRAEVKDKLKMGSLSLADLLTQADSNETIGKMKVVSVLESLPGLGKVKARRLMETVGISDSRRLQGLGAKQRESLLKETAR